MRNRRLYNFFNKIILGKTSYPSLRYRYFCKLLEKDFGSSGSPIMLAVSPICKRKVATNFLLFLGYSLSSELNARVLLVDTTFESKKCSLSTRLNARNRKGFFQLTAGEDSTLNDKIVKSQVENVFLLPSGANEDTIRFVIDHDQLARVCEKIGVHFDYIIFLQDDLRVDTRYISLSYLVNLNLLLVQENETLLSDIDECQKLYEDNGISQFKLIMTSA